MTNVITSSVSLFSADAYWQENKTDSVPGLTVADIGTRAIAAYFNEIDKKLKEVNQAANGQISTPSGAFGGAISADAISTAADVVLGSTSDGASHGLTILAGTSKTSSIEFGDVNDNNIGSIHYHHLTNETLFIADTVDVMYVGSSSIRPAQTDGSIDNGTSSNRWGTLYAGTGSFGSVSPSQASSLANDLVVGSTDEIQQGISIFSNNSTGQSIIAFADTDDTIAGLFQYQHQFDQFMWRVDGGNVLGLRDAGGIDSYFGPQTDSQLYLGRPSQQWNTLYANTASLNDGAGHINAKIAQHVPFAYSAVGTGVIYIPFIGSVTTNTIDDYRVNFITPASGTIKSIKFRGTSTLGSTTIGLHIDRVETAVATDTQTVNSGTVTSFAFNYDFNPDVELAVSVNPTNTHGDTNGTLEIWLETSGSF